MLVARPCPILYDTMEPARLLCPWNSPGKNTGVGCHSFFQGVFPIQGWNQGLPHCRQILLCEPPGKPPGKLVVIRFFFSFSRGAATGYIEGWKIVLPKVTQFYTQKQKTYQMETIQGFSVDLVLEILGLKKI